jgi:hypothetical protein
VVIGEQVPQPVGVPGSLIAWTSPGGEIRHSGERLSDLAAEGGSGCHDCAVLDKVNSVLDRVWPHWTRWWWVVVLVIAGVTGLGVREPWLLPLYVLVVLVWGRAIVRGVRAFADEWRSQR